MNQYQSCRSGVLSWLYLLNASALITHEIDSAYWNEWELFGLPGGIQLFLVLNLFLVMFVLYGLQALAQDRTSGIVISWVLVAGGLFAGLVHGFFILSGDPAFRLPVSIFLLAATFVISLIQAVALLIARNSAN